MNSVDWKDVAHFGSAFVCLAMAGLTEMGVQLPGVSVDPKVAGAAGIGILAAGLKSGVTSGKAAIGFLAFALAAASVGEVHAANLNPPMVTKAPVNPFQGYTTGACGMYFGFNTMGAAGAVSGGVPGASVIQGDIGATLGYGCPIGTTPGNFWFVEGNFDWANVNGTTSGLSLTGPAHFEQRFALGSPLSSVLNTLPNNPFGNLAVPSTPLCPTNVTCGNQYPFIFVSLHEQDIGAQVGVSQNREWLLSPGIGLGLESRWSNGVVVDVTAQYKLDSNAFALGPVSKVSLGNAAIVGLTFKY